ncbi:hypothetical protein RU86_GL000611 [Lactococcus piscium]|uniref:Uncharacterized protein n=1 Tax=Pseudolactococcus piscium TaxID=1364 RepID=A0A2A5RX80_9LACT|nr:hypothetical protein RU86_GL000611 [Lactococcus piscium]
MGSSQKYEWLTTPIIVSTVLLLVLDKKLTISYLVYLASFSFSFKRIIKHSTLSACAGAKLEI